MKRVAFALPVLLVVSVLGVVVVGLPTAGARQGFVLGEEQLSRLSQAAALNYLLTHPEQAPPQLRRRFEAFEAKPPGDTREIAPEGSGGAFNFDTTGLPQNEESVTVCRSRPSTVLGGTNDFRGLDPEQGTIGTGWHLSTNGGDSVANEGLLPALNILGKRLPAAGDPVVAADDSCRLFAASLSLNFVDFPDSPLTGISLYRSDAGTLVSCPGGANPSCWPKRRLVAAGGPNHFLDKPWFDVGQSGTAGEVVWVTYTDFEFDPNTFEETSSIKAVRCDPALVACTAPILIGSGGTTVQFSDVTVGPDGRTYVTWTEVHGGFDPNTGESLPQTFIHKLRIAPAGSTTFGPTRVVTAEGKPIPFGGLLHANDFRVATIPKNEVALVGGHPRVFVVWDACRALVLDDVICEEPEIKLRYSDNDGATWRQTVLSRGGDNYFPTIHENGAGRLAVAWFTNRFDGRFHNKQDVELTSVGAASATATEPQRITPTSNESEADPFVGGSFIGDYIEVFANRGTAWVHYNANYRQVPFEGRGFPIPQQDNFLARVGF